MQKFSTIIGVIELRQDGMPFKTIRSRYEIGSSTISLIMERFRELGFTLEELSIMNPQDVESKFYPEENRRDTSKPRPDFFVIHDMMTKMKHMPPEHVYYKELNAYDGAYYRRWASVYDTPMTTLIDSILKGVKHEEQAYNSCKGILHMCKNVPDHVVKEAAQICIDANACKYSYFKRTLSKLANDESEKREQGAHLPEHENIRGREYFK